MSKEDPILAYARINARIRPIDRGERFEDPLQETLEGTDVAEVTGGGTLQAKSGEIVYCGIDVDLYDLEQAISLICTTLEGLGAPKGSALEYEVDGERKEVPFGVLEGLAIYLNGTDLPDEVYKASDINDVVDRLINLLGDRGEMLGYWEGPEETALYFYGESVDEMKQLIAEFVATHPLCELARCETIA